MRRIAHEAGITIAGPNCAGTIDPLDDARPFAATFLRDLPNRASFIGRRVAFVSQSGAIAEELIARSHAMAIPLGAVVSVGNALHLSLADYLEHFGADEACGAVALYAESFGDVERFVTVAREVARRKPVVALLGGRLPEGAAAAQRHTGAASLRDADARAFNQLVAGSTPARPTSYQALTAFSAESHSDFSNFLPATTRSLGTLSANSARWLAPRWAYRMTIASVVHPPSCCSTGIGVPF